MPNMLNYNYSCHFFEAILNISAGNIIYNCLLEQRKYFLKTAITPRDECKPCNVIWNRKEYKTDSEETNHFPRDLQIVLMHSVVYRICKSLGEICLVFYPGCINLYTHSGYYWWVTLRSSDTRHDVNLNIFYFLFYFIFYNTYECKQQITHLHVIGLERKQSACLVRLPKVRLFKQSTTCNKLFKTN